jgi:hypothetical protein
MIDPEALADRQMELATEFAKYVLDHPDVDDMLPEESYVYFQIDGETEFNEYSQQLAERREQQEGVTADCVRVQGLAPPQGSRLIDPQIVPSPNLA